MARKAIRTGGSGRKRGRIKSGVTKAKKRVRKATPIRKARRGPKRLKR